MGSNDSLRQTLDHFKKQKERKLDELRALELMIRQLRRELGEETKDDDQAEFSLGTAESSDPSADRETQKKSEIRPDEFFGLSQGEASKRYLQKIGHAVSLDELLDALKKGGCKVGGANPRRVLHISLVRNVREFVPVQNGYIGLREFYPAKKAGLAKKPKASKPKKKVVAGIRVVKKKMKKQESAEPA